MCLSTNKEIKETIIICPQKIKRESEKPKTLWITRDTECANTGHCLLKSSATIVIYSLFK